jgi:hypothetical protein
MGLLETGLNFVMVEYTRATVEEQREEKVQGSKFRVQGSEFRVPGLAGC